MFGDKHPEVLIAGAGPVGLFTALSLARRGVAVRIVDTGVWACTHSYALALQPQTLPLFEELGLLDRVMHNCYRVNTMALADAGGPRTRIALGGDDAKGCLAVLRQDVLEALLERALGEHGVQVDWRREVSNLVSGAGSVRAGIDRFEKESRGYIIAHTEWVIAGSTTAEVPYAIGADGYNSRVRRALDYDFPEVGPAQYYAVFEFSTDADLKHEMTVVFGEKTADVLWPLPGGDCRWSFLLPGYSDPQTEEIKDVLASSGFGHFPTERLKDRVFRGEGNREALLSEESLRRMIAARAPWFTAHVNAVKWRTIVRFERRLSTGFGRGRLWLAGDSAHLTGPVGIQSMNVGLAEGHDLAVALAAVLRDGASPSILDAYGQRWLGVWKELHGQTLVLKPGASANPWVVSHAKDLLACLPGYGPRLNALASQIGLSAVKPAGAAG
ncbi:MAG: FAD-dependent monooxygenase [Bryobacteraceae bacterium]|jgi:2-polyprenyl-6-methoxyphenol hydroxylase-like FAD-dependent oxidoreductase